MYSYCFGGYFLLKHSVYSNYDKTLPFCKWQSGPFSAIQSIEPLLLLFLQSTTVKKSQQTIQRRPIIAISKSFEYWNKTTKVNQFIFSRNNLLVTV